MKNETLVCVTGNVAAELKSGLGKDGVPYVHFRMGSTPRRLINGQWVDGPTSWYKVSCFRGLAEHAKASIDKGHPIVVYGKQTIREWATEQQRGINVEIEAYVIGHDLNWGTSMFRKTGRRRAAAPVPDDVPVDENGVVLDPGDRGSSDPGAPLGDAAEFAPPGEEHRAA